MKRIAWLDIAKFFFIMTVIYSHLETIIDEFSCLVVPFMLPGFLFASGYTHRYGQNFRSFFIKKFRTLFIPWLVLGLFDICVSQVLSFGEHNFLSELFWNFLQIRGRNDKLWFVAALFTAYFPFYFFIEWFNRKNAKDNHRVELFMLIALAIFCAGILYNSTVDPAIFPWGTNSLPWHIDYSFRAIFFMAVGYFFHEKYEAYYERFNPYVRVIVLFVCHAAIVYAPYFVAIPSGLFSVLANLITPLLGILTVVSVSKVFPENRFALFVGQNTLLYFGFQGKVYGVIEGLARRLFAVPYAAILSNKLSSLIFSIALTFVVAIILIIPCVIVNRYFPFILGRKRSTKTAPAK